MTFDGASARTLADTLSDLALLTEAVATPIHGHICRCGLCVLHRRARGVATQLERDVRRMAAAIEVAGVAVEAARLALDRKDATVAAQTELITELRDVVDRQTSLMAVSRNALARLSTETAVLRREQS